MNERFIFASRPRARQHGASLLLILLVLGLIAFFVTLLVKMGPAYMTFWQVRSVINRVADKPDMQQTTPALVLKAIENQMNIEGVRSVDSRSFRVLKDGEQLKIVVAYEVRTPVYANVDVVMRFGYEKPIQRP